MKFSFLILQSVTNENNIIKAMRKLLISLVLSVSAITSIAQNNINIYPKNGAPVTYALTQNPKITYENQNLVVSISDIKISYPLSDFQKFTFEDLPSGISSTTVISKTDSPLSIYTLGGALVKTIAKGKADDVRISLDELDKGVYIIKRGNTTFKVAKE